MKKEMESTDCAVELVCSVPIKVEPYTSDHARGVLAKRQIMTWLRVGRFLCETLPNMAKTFRHGAWTGIKYALGFAIVWFYAALLVGGGN